MIEAITVSKMGLYIYTKRRMREVTHFAEGI